MDWQCCLYKAMVSGSSGNTSGPTGFPMVTRYVSALGWVRVQVLLVSSSAVSAWPLVSHGGHDGVLGCPFCWHTGRILHRSSCSCGPLHACFCCQLGWTPCRIPHRNRSAQTPLDPSGGSSYAWSGWSSL
jgi:hypothetical protein